MKEEELASIKKRDFKQMMKTNQDNQSLHWNLWTDTKTLLKPTRSPSPPSPRSLPCCSILLPQSPGGARRAGSCRRRGCRGWSTCPAGGVEPGDSTQPEPRPEEGWAVGNPPPAEPRSWCHPAGRSSTEMFHVAEPGERDVRRQGNKSSLVTAAKHLP